MTKSYSTLPESIDHYDILQVSRDASSQMIDEAYRKAAFLHHPDRYVNGISMSGEMMKKVNNAKVVLLDPVARREYDARRAYAPAPTEPGLTQDQRAARKQQKKTQHQQRMRQRAERQRRAHDRARERASKAQERIARLRVQQEHARMDRAEQQRAAGVRIERSQVEEERKSRLRPPTHKGRKARRQRQEALQQSREIRKRQKQRVLRINHQLGK
jgi:curved DNA-binding protein CbpA